MRKGLLTAMLGLALLLESGEASAQPARCDSSSLNAADRQQIEQYVHAAIQFEKSGQIDSAIEMNKHVLGVCPNFAPAMTTIAGLYGLQGNLDGEVEWATKAIAADSLFGDGYIDLANAYVMKGNKQLARTTLERAMAIDPKNPVAYYTMGIMAEDDTDQVAALDWYHKSMDCDSTFPPSYFNAGLIYIQTGELEKALPLIQHVTELDPTDDQAKDVLANLYMAILKQRQGPQNTESATMERSL